MLALNQGISKIWPHQLTPSPLNQDNSSRDCLLPLMHRPEKSFRQARLGDVDPDNVVLRTLVKRLEQYVAPVLGTSAQKAGKLQSIPAQSTPFIFKCAHDAVQDPSTGDKIAPHLIADCTALCKAVADASVKQRLGDAEEEPYEVTAANARKSVKRAQARVKKAKQKEAKTKKNCDTSAKKMKSATSAKAAAKMKKKCNQDANAYIKAQKAVKDAEVAAQQAETDASDAIDKHEQVIQTQNHIIQSWQGVMSNLTRDKLLTVPDFVESFLVFLPPCSKCKDQQCACTWLRGFS